MIEINTLIPRLLTLTVRIISYGTRVTELVGSVCSCIEATLVLYFVPGRCYSIRAEA